MSRAASVRSASAEKSTWPGESTSVIATPARSIAAWDEKIVMPRSRSMRSVSRCESPRSTRPAARIAPASSSIASASVVLPASTCANMPMTACLILSSPPTSRVLLGGARPSAARLSPIIVEVVAPVGKRTARGDFGVP